MKSVRIPTMLDAAEMAEDIASIGRFQARLAAGVEEMVPADVVNALLDGGNPIRVWREHRGLSAKDLAKKAELAPAYLSQIESGKGEGTIATLRSIATALDVTVDDLIG